ncbi:MULTISPECIES: LysR family transcriptional regulator [Pseudomonas]|uniref:LysR family transcriptional regulator n=1 Tax=Pseudomonas TaxID=286 RepID=UPI0006D3C116|nr:MULTISPECIES: LysR family transcriptional regulator [Pseudomonas]MCE4069017.1 LysR family transcriptional regulator [Pseudomonas nitritireducens]MCE4078206.1 LysR family transcriptional regulator [Pseudomonas nitroreducens]OBY92681.1 LysR family transcriptional regulator [Pseudomonas sp. AU11447]
MNMNTFDLNLLRVLDALLRERNVSRAAERLSLSQPAVSNALNRLRELLDDPLLVRVGRAMQPTPRALELEAPIRDALQRIGQSLAGGDTFDPARSRQRFTMALTDYVEALCMPHLLESLGSAAPGMGLSIQHLTPTLPAEALDKGNLDLVLGRFEELPARFQRRPWASETLRLLARRGHPQVNGGIDLQTFLGQRHLWVSGGQTKGMVDQWLASQGLKREIAYTTPNYLQAAHLVASTDLLTVLPTRLATYFAELLPLQVLELPFDVGQFHLELVYLAQRERDAALQWLVERIIEAAPD